MCHHVNESGVKIVTAKPWQATGKCQKNNKLKLDFKAEAFVAEEMCIERNQELSFVRCISILHRGPNRLFLLNAPGSAPVRPHKLV